MVSTLQTIDLHNTTGAYYAPGIVTAPGKLLHVAGQPGTNASGQAPSDYQSQIHLSLLNLHRVIAAAGATPRDIVKLNLYIVNYDPDQRQHTRPLQTFLGSHRPAITLIPVPQLAAPRWLFEVDALVSLPNAPSIPLAKCPASLPYEDVDVVVIGAGLSGLTAAEHVINAGKSCIVLEARDRVGGRTFSQSLGKGGVVDLGAAWINDSNQNRMIALARRSGAELIEQNTTGNCLLQRQDGTTVVFPYGQTPTVRVSSLGHYHWSGASGLTKSSRSVLTAKGNWKRYETWLRLIVRKSTADNHAMRTWTRSRSSRISEVATRARRRLQRHQFGRGQC